MASALQIQANRANARCSTGPKSHGGKSRAARNARRHGLSISGGSNPGLSADAEALAHELAGPAADPELLYRAREAAAAHIDVDRVRRARHRLIVQELADPCPLPKSTRAKMQQVKDLICLEERLSQGLYLSWQLRSLLRTPDEAEKFAAVISNVARQLAILERYECRAVSRRRKAFRSFDIAQRKSNFCKEWAAN
jgi:hypothetical protein